MNKQTEMAKQLFKERKQWQDKVKKIKAEALAEIKAWTQKDIEDIQSVARLEVQKEAIKKTPLIIKEQEARIVELEKQISIIQEETQKKLEDLREILYEGSMDYINCKYCNNFVKNKLKAIEFIDEIFNPKSEVKK
jgi:hypothetical protein